MEYKKIEKKHYNSIAISSQEKGIKNADDFVNVQADEYFHSQVRECLKRKETGLILDYGCGTGDKLERYHKFQKWSIIGIDISEESIKLARKSHDFTTQVKYMVMDCEKTEFPDNTFDIIIDYGTFSSVDIKKGSREISRIIKPDGILICIETLGHNPFANINRKINMLRGKRTIWATNHIMTNNSWRNFKRKFEHESTHYFNLLPILFVPLFRIALPKIFIKLFIKMLWNIDGYLIRLPKAKYYCFKTVNIYQKKRLE
jgi:ubiquinone/menaquinone biosynthesis C-methylase UbiE